MGLVDNHSHTWPKPLQPLEHHAFRLVWIGTLASNAGSWMQRVATGWLVYTMTGSTAWLGAEAFTAGIPAVLLLPVGGVLADRLNRRTMLIMANLINASLAVLLALGWWAGVLTVWQIIATSFLSGVVSAVMVPASQSMLPAVVGEDHLTGAIALNSVQYNVARAIGPALGGIALAWGGPGWCFILNAVSFLVLVGAFAMIGKIPQQQNHAHSIVKSLREGMTFLKNRTDLRLMLLLVGVLAFGAAPAVTMLPAYAKDILHRDASTYSILLTCFGAGAAGAGVMLTLHPASKRSMRWVYAAILGVGVCHIGLAVWGLLPVAATLSTVAGACFVGAMIELGSGLVGLTPDEFRGRVSSVQQVVFRAAQPLGGLLAGLAAERLGLPGVFVGFGAFLILGALVLWITKRSAVRDSQ